MVGFNGTWPPSSLCHVIGCNLMMTSSNGNIFRVTGLFAWNSPVTDEFPSQRPVTPSFDVLFDLGPKKRLSKQWRGWWFETPSSPLWLYRNAYKIGEYFFAVTDRQFIIICWNCRQHYIVIKQLLANSRSVFLGHIFQISCSYRQVGFHYIIIQNPAKINIFL